MDTYQAAPAQASIDFDAGYYLSINGALVRASETFDVLNPATNHLLAKAPRGTVEHLDEAIATAKVAFKAWSALSWSERGDYLTAYADALEQNKDELITILTLEQGKPRHTMATSEITESIAWIRETAKRRLEVEVIEDTDTHVVEVHRTPLGVVGAITPWNFPVFLALWKVAPCLLAGNTLVMKPSPYTPLTSLRFGEIGQQVFPPGVLSVISGGNDLGQHLTEHPGVAKITLTGSTETGRRVMASAASNIKRLTLELGGNDAAIVLADANLKTAIPSLFWAAFGNSAQWCIAPKRIYVHASIYQTFLKGLVEYASTKVVGDGMEPTSDLGPIQNRMQYNKLVNLFEDVRANGYIVALGGTIDQSLAGNFIPVTIIDNPPEMSRVVQEEAFGPILPILSFDSVEEVIAKANGPDVGLGGSVWGTNREEAIAVALRLETGTVWVNEIQTLGVDIPFGGHKQSGLGVESGRQGLSDFTNSKTYMFPR